MDAERGAGAEGATDLRNCLFRLKTECEIEGLDKRAGFDAWVAWANRLLDERDAPVSRPGRLASEDARAEATRLPEQPSPGFDHQSRGQVVPFALASEGKSDAEAQKAGRRAADPGAGDEVGRDRFHRLLIAFHDAIRRPLGVTPASGDEFYDWRLAEAAEERRPRVGTEPERRERPEVRLVAAQREKAAAVGLLDGQISIVRGLEAKLATAEARAEAARARAIKDCIAALKALHQPFVVPGFSDGSFESTVQGRALAALAAQIGGTAREGASPDAEGGHGRG